MTAAEVDMLLDSASQKSFDDEADAAAELVTVTMAMNQELNTPGFTERGFGGDVGRKLREWIQKLVALLKRIVQDFGAIHYSIGVSLTGVSASVEWAGPKGG